MTHAIPTTTWHLRSDVGRDRRCRLADHLPRLDRTRPARGAQGRRRRHQLRLAFAVADHRAGREPVRLGSAGAISKNQFAAVESGIGWVPWALDAMDEAAVKHHLWAYPRLKKLPSEYFRSNGAATFQEDRAGLALAETFNLVDNFMWANDYPHAEGHLAAFRGSDRARDGQLKEESRAKILGLNAAKMFKFDVELLLERRRKASVSA